MLGKIDEKNKLTEEKILDILKNENFRPESTIFSVPNLSDELKKKRLIIDNEYQRNYLYNDKFKIPSKFVESVFMGIVIPEIQIFRSNETRIKELIDGQQRVLSLVKFYNNEFALEGLEELPELNGYFFCDLDYRLQTMFEEFQIRARIVANNSQYKYQMFERLNTGSKQLNKQEVRNCVYRGKMLSFAKEMSNNEIVQKVLYGLTDERYDRTEFILRVLAIICNQGRQEESSISKNIDKFMSSEYCKYITDEQINSIRINFIDTFKTLYDLLDNDLLFEKSKVTKVHIEPIIISVYNMEQKRNLILNKDIINEQLCECITSNEYYLKTMERQTNSKYNTNDRIFFIKKLLNEIVDSSSVKLDPKRYFTLDERFLLWQKAWSIDKGVKCAICGQKINMFDDAEADHIIPWSKGGQTTLDNAQLVHKICNKSKSNKL